MGSSLKDALEKQTSFACSYRRSNGEELARVFVPFKRVERIIFYGEVLPEERRHILHQVADAIGISKVNEESDVDTLLGFLNIKGVGVYQNKHKDINSAFAAVVSRFNNQIAIEQVEAMGIFPTGINIKINSLSDESFMFWNCITSTGPENDLHITPNYHPGNKGYKHNYFINGHTNAVCGNNVIESSYCPAESVRPGERQSWDYVNHPYYAKCKSFEIRIDEDLLLTDCGEQDLVNLISSAYMRNNSYVAISGGFDAPFISAHNLICELDIESPYWKSDEKHSRDHYARGSEEHCVWAYRTLEKEGELENARIPKWFLEEGWLSLYKNVE